jgi:hypothetical protein
VHRQFARLTLEEDFFYAHGIMPQETWRVLHPLHDAESHDGRHRPTGLAPTCWNLCTSMVPRIRATSRNNVAANER